MDLPELYLEKMRALLGESEFEAYRKSLDGEICRGLRLNPLKVSEKQKEQVLKAAGACEEVPWSGGEGYYCEEKAVPSRHPYYAAGLYYLQEPSAMAPGAILPVKPGDRVLDLCAAPGGKSTRLGAALSGKGFLLSNDISVSRSRGLLKNLELFGIGNSFVSSEDPEKLVSCFRGFFDSILVDAPCSGEGMFRREPSMAADWNQRGPEYYIPVQRRLLAAAEKMLRPGGFLLYSTCTFDRGENEENVKWFLGESGNMRQVPIKAEHGMSQGFDGASVRLFPWKLRGEGHFAALFRKEGEPVKEVPDRQEEKRRERNKAFLNSRKEFSSFREQICIPLEKRGFYWEKNGQIYLLPVSPDKIPKIRFLRTGLLLGDIRKGRFEPSQALAMYLKKEEFAGCEELAGEDLRAIKYLKGETIESDSQEGKGWRLVCTDGWPLGFARKNGFILKNKYYPGWRWQ